MFFGRFLQPIDINDGYTREVKQMRNKVTVTGHVNATFINFIKFLGPIDVTDGYKTHANKKQNNLNYRHKN